MPAPTRKHRHQIRVSAATQRTDAPSGNSKERGMQSPPTDLEDKGDTMPQQREYSDQPQSTAQSSQMNDTPSNQLPPQTAQPSAEQPEVQVVHTNELKYLATKEDIGRLAGSLAIKADKSDLARLETELKGVREELKGVQEHIRENLVTKADIVRLETELNSVREHIRENLATKADLANLRVEIATAMNQLLYRMLGGMAALLIASQALFRFFG